MSFVLQKRLKTTFFLILGVAIWACHPTDKKDKEEVIYNQQLSKSLAKPLDLNQVSKSHLISQADEEVSNWSEFLTLKVEMEKLQKYSLQDLMDAGSTILGSIEKVQDSIPEKFKTTPVESRLNVLLTKSKILNQYLKYQKKDTLELQQMGAAIFEAYENLEIQLNEVYLQQFSEFDFDMDRHQDSIQNARKHVIEKKD